MDISTDYQFKWVVKSECWPLIGPSLVNALPEKSNKWRKGKIPLLWKLDRHVQPEKSGTRPESGLVTYWKPLPKKLVPNPLKGRLNLQPVNLDMVFPSWQVLQFGKKWRKGRTILQVIWVSPEIYHTFFCNRGANCLISPSFFSFPLSIFSLPLAEIFFALNYQRHSLYLP